MKFLILGKGLLGSALNTHALKQGADCTAMSHEECDVTDDKTLNAAIDKIAPEIIINATGYTGVDGAENETEKCFNINAKAVGILAKICSKRKIPLAHFSTDYIFSGLNDYGYKESAKPDPINAYGKSKAEGEKELISNTDKFYLVRTAWLYGPTGKNFVDTMLKLAETQNEIKVVSDQIGCPTYVFDLAQAVYDLLERGKYGIYHIVNEGKTSWYGFAEEIFHTLGIPKKIIPITSEELNRRAKRPKNSVLLNTLAPRLRNWKDALKEYLMDKTIIV